MLVRISRHLRILSYCQFSRNQHTIYSKEAFKPKAVDFNKQSIVLPGPEGIRASPLSEDPNTLIDTIPGAPEIKTVYDVLGHGLKVSNDGPCIGRRKSTGSNEYEWQSYSEFISRTRNVGSGLIHLGLKPENNTFIGIFAANQEETLLSYYACAGYSMVMVPFYMTLGSPTIIYIINHAKLPTVICTNNHNTDLILNNAKSVPTVKTLITCSGPTEEQRKLARNVNIKIVSFSEIEEMGKTNRKELVMPKPEDTFMIPFTSGTTGIPKGAILSHRNLITMVASVVHSYGEVGIFGGCIMSYLPPAHAYEICNWVGSLYYARAIAFYGGVIQNLMEDVRTVQPTILPLVPRIMSKIYTEALKKIKESKIKSMLLPIALAQKVKLFERGQIRDTIWDKFIFKDFQAQLGGRVHAIPLTSAPVPQDVKSFFMLASGAHIMESYGSTEIMAAVLKLPKDLSKGYIGCPMVCNHLKLADVPEMEYFSKDDTGEICAKGPSVFKGYLNNPEATKEAMNDGWFHTGDIGKWLPNGALTIIDRKKHLFKLSQGEYIAPEKIENVYIYCNLVLQIIVDGLPEKDYVIALVVPEPTAFKKWLASKGFTGTEKISELLSDKEIRKDFLLKLHHHGKENHLNALEQARNMAFLSEPFTIDNDLLTPTFKIKRNIARKRFQQIYQQLYDEGPLIASLKS